MYFHIFVLDFSHCMYFRSGRIKERSEMSKRGWKNFPVEKFDFLKK